MTDARKSITPGAPQLHEPVPNNTAAYFQVNTGDIDGGFRDCDLIVEQEFSTQRHSAVPLENRGLVAEWDEGRELLTMWGPTKMTHTNWRILSELLGMPQSAIHFIEPEVGGGFGARGEFYPEDFLIPFAASVFASPFAGLKIVQRISKRSINRASRRIASKSESKKTAPLRPWTPRFSSIWALTRGPHGGVPAIAASAMLRGPFKVKNYRCNVFCVLTNKTPVGTYRSPADTRRTSCANVSSIWLRIASISILPTSGGAI